MLEHTEVQKRYEQVMADLDRLDDRARRGLKRCTNINGMFGTADVSIMTIWKTRKGHRPSPEKLFVILDVLEANGVDMSEGGG